jgi:glycerophosphoryl diester phosphodiesterase
MEVIAHRGNSFHFPENTLSAFQSAVEVGADYVELDSRVTKDGMLVVLHDDKLDRTTNAAKVFGATSQFVAQKTYDQIRELDAGSWKAPQFSGEGIPTLEESVKTIQAGSVTLLERKSGSALAHAKLLDTLGFTGSLIVQSFDWDFLAALKTWRPQVQLAALCGEEVTRDRLDDLKRAGIPLAVWDHEKIGPESAPLLGEYGIRLWVYTVDEPTQWTAIAKLGVVEGMVTNKPAELIAWLKEQGLR